MYLNISCNKLRFKTLTFEPRKTEQAGFLSLPGCSVHDQWRPERAFLTGPYQRLKHG